MAFLDSQSQAVIGPAPVPPAGTPFTRTDAHGDFLFRFPLLKGVPGDVLPAQIQLAGGAIAVSPAAPTIVVGRTELMTFQRA